jgi:hypothetical protein
MQSGCIWVVRCVTTSPSRPRKRSGPNALPTHNPRYPKFLLRSVAARLRVPIIEDFPTFCIRASYVPLREWKPYSVPKVLCICMNRLASFCWFAEPCVIFAHYFAHWTLLTSHGSAMITTACKSLQICRIGTHATHTISNLSVYSWLFGLIRYAFAQSSYLVQL